MVVGVDNQGLVYVTILDPSRTSVKFVFGPTEWHNFKDTDGTSVTQKEANEIRLQFAVHNDPVLIFSPLFSDV